MPGNCFRNKIAKLNQNNLIYLTDCCQNKLTSLKIKTTNTFEDLDFHGNYSLRYICCNRREIDFVTDKAVDYGLSNCRINGDCTN